MEPFADFFMTSGSSGQEGSSSASLPVRKNTARAPKRRPQLPLSYLIAIVTPGWLATPPAMSKTGTALPEGAPHGTRIWIWSTPASPGAASADRMSAVYEPAVTKGVSRGAGRGSIATAPSMPGGFVWPCPVANRVTISPRAAGFAAEFKLPFAFSIAPGPAPEPPAVKIPGAAAATGTEPRNQPLPRTYTWTASLSWTSYGTIALICVSDA